jgi:hypothetical protein
MRGTELRRHVHPLAKLRELLVAQRTRRLGELDAGAVLGSQYTVMSRPSVPVLTATRIRSS